MYIPEVSHVQWATLSETNVGATNDHEYIVNLKTYSLALIATVFICVSTNNIQ